MTLLLWLLASPGHAACNQPTISPSLVTQVTADGQPPERSLPELQRPRQRPIGAAAMSVVPGLGHLHTCDERAAVSQGVTSSALILTGMGLNQEAGPIRTPVAISATHTGRSLAWYSAYDAYRVSKMQQGPVQGRTTVDGASLKNHILAPFRRENILAPANLFASGLAAGLVTAQFASGAGTPWPDRVDWGGGSRQTLGNIGVGTAWVGYTVTNVAVSEEAMFRGLLQPILVDLTRRPWLGMTLSNMLFGLAHFDLDDPATGAISATYITLASFDVSISAHKHGYDLGRPIAAHFWYDTILITGTLLLDPRDSPWEFVFTVPL